jgi:uncharacterized membrane protein YbhN (UPF0104 family)
LIAEQPYVKKIITVVKFALLPITFGFIFYKLFYAYDIDKLWHESTVVWDTQSMGLLFFTLLLMVFNWLLETLKWRLLVQKNENITFTEALQGVLSGVALNMITPNQLGDFVGRVIHLKKLDKVRGTLITVIGHTAQVIMTAAFGLCALTWFLLYNQTITEQQSNTAYLILLVLVILTIAAYLNMAWLSKLKITAKIKPYLDVFKLYKRSELVQILMVSFLRYIIFLSQYYCLLLLFRVDVTFAQGMACIIATLCAQSFVPSFILVEVGMRGASALWFFGMFTAVVTPVLLTAYSLWIINLMIPGLVGLVFIIKWRQVNK